jgi:protein-S-isoprenylcysteine O-methyltransferase Ste14
MDLGSACGERDQKGGQGMITNVVTLVVMAGVAVLLALNAGRVAWTPVKLVGAAIAAVSMVLLLTARIQLGRSFSVTPQARKLVTTGLYARIRNPIYVFSWFYLLGLVIVLEFWILLLPLAALAAAQLFRARKEEAVLTEAFGEEYARYKAGTWF